MIRLRPSEIIAGPFLDDCVKCDKISPCLFSFILSFLCFLENVEEALLDKGHKMSSDCGPKEKDIDAADDSPGI